MNPIASVTPNLPNAGMDSLDLTAQLNPGDAKDDPEKTAEAARQFEAILLRQFLGESMKPLLQGGPSGQVYGYLMTESLADTMTKAGGLGISSILQAQLTR